DPPPRPDAPPILDLCPSQIGRKPNEPGTTSPRSASRGGAGGGGGGAAQAPSVPGDGDEDFDGGADDGGVFAPIWMVIRSPTFASVPAPGVVTIALPASPGGGAVFSAVPTLVNPASANFALAASGSRPRTSGTFASLP